jgi:predicted dehydrogenase
MGRWHAHALRRTGGILAAVIDENVARAKSLAKRADVATRLEDVLESGIDAVHICTPLDTHYDLAHAALDAKAHVIVEKPVAETVAHTTDLIQSAIGKGLYVCPVHQFPFQNGVTRAAVFLAKLGSVQEIAFTVCSGGGTGGTADALDATVNDILPHPLSVLRQLWPETVLDPSGWGAFKASPGNLHIAGVHGTAQLGISISMHARPTCCELVIRCSGGTILVDFFHGFAVLERGSVSRWQKIVRPFKRADGLYLAASMNLMRRVVRREPAYPGLTTLIDRFYAGVAGRGPLPIDPADTLAIAQARASVMGKVS